MARRKLPPVRRAAADLGPAMVAVEGRAGKLRLDYNENTSGCSPAVRKALSRLTAAEISMYPEYEATRRQLAGYFGVRPSELVLANGADDSLRIVMDVFLEPGASVLLVEPTFPMFRFYAALAGARIRTLRYDAEMHFPLAAVLRELARRPRVFFLANPNNPTGTLLGRAALRQILEAARDTAVVVDEAYAEFSGVTVLPWIRRYPNLIVVRTFSKAMGLAGLRLGFVIAGKELAALCQRTQPPFSVNTPALVAARAAIADRVFPHKYVDQVNRSCSMLSAWLARKGVRVFPSAASFLFADFGPVGSRLAAALARQGILIRDRSQDFDRPGFVRITLGTPAEMRRLIRALDPLLGKSTRQVL